MQNKLYADLVIKNANMWTMEEDKPRAESLAVFYDTIMKVGSNSEIENLIGSNTEIIDAEGNTVIPGFIDAHTHIAWNGMNKVYLYLGDTRSLEEAVELVKKECEKKEPGEWIIGRAWDQSNWPEQRYITAADIDSVSPNNPVNLVHVSGHFATVNTIGFTKLNLSKEQQGVDVDENGEIIGTLRDVDLSDKKELRPKFDDLVKGINFGIEECLSLGITSVHDNLTFENLLPYIKLARNNQLKIRIYGIIYEDMIDEAIKLGLSKIYADKWLKIGAVKLMTDGAISARTAYIYDDYDDKEGEKGFALYDETMLDEMVVKVHNAGMQIAAHAIGDKAIANVITAIEKNIDSVECKKSLHRIEHAELLLEEDAKRASKLGLVMSMQPNFVWRWGMIGVNGMYEQRLGTERTMINNPFKWVLDNDMLIAFGSDGMPLGPIYGIKGAIYHPDPSLRLTLEESIRCFTLYPAITSGEEKIKGSLSSGKLADIVILNRNLDEIDLDSFHDVEVKFTIVGGVIEYKK